MKIRQATLDDSDEIRGLHVAAFPESEGGMVARLAVDLLAEESLPPVISLVAEVDGKVVGHVAFSPVTTEGTGEFLGYILAPLAVSPDFQKCGIGTKLIEDGIGRLSDSNPGVLVVYGDPGYYGRLGFSASAAVCLLPPYQLQYPFGWQGMVLNGCGGRNSPVRISCVAALGNPALW
jgi:putative acetyltransferase